MRDWAKPNSFSGDDGDQPAQTGTMRASLPKNKENFPTLFAILGIQRAVFNAEDRRKEGVRTQTGWGQLGLVVRATKAD